MAVDKSLICAGCGISIENAGYRVVAGQPWHFECDGDALRQAVKHLIRVARGVPDILEWAANRMIQDDASKARQWDEQRVLLQEVLLMLENGVYGPKFS